MQHLQFGMSWLSFMLHNVTQTNAMERNDVRSASIHIVNQPFLTYLPGVR